MGLKEPGLRGSLRNVSVGIDVIPDSVTSRPDDDNDGTSTDSLGIVINPKSDFLAVGARISNNTEDPERARLYDYSNDSYIATADLSDKNTGDTFKFEVEIKEGQDYGIEVDADGDTYIIGTANDADDFPYTGDDINIVGESDGGTKTTNRCVGVDDVGNPDGVLD